MPVQVTFPGVYVQEVARSSSRTIEPVAMGICAFVGRTALGPIDLPVTISSFADFERIFGWLSADYPMSYAVSDFFANGGREAVIVRLYVPLATSDGVARLTLGETAVAPLALCAANPGSWGNRLTATIDTDDITAVTAEQFAVYGLDQGDLFNLTLALHDATGACVLNERHLNLSVRHDEGAKPPKRVDRVLAEMSELARVEHLSAAPPPPGSAVADGGDDGGYLDGGTYLGDRDARHGLYMLEHVDRFGLLVIPPDRPGPADDTFDLPPPVHRAAASYCTDRRAIYLVDPPVVWRRRFADGGSSALDRDALSIHGTSDAGVEIARNAAIYFPFVRRDGDPAVCAPGGAIAGFIATTDRTRGVWKAPAGMSATLVGITGLDIDIDDEAAARLTRIGINCLRNLPGAGPVVWSARTVRGADQFEDDYKYLPIRRLTLFIEESVRRGTLWTAFEPNDETLWSALRLATGAFMADLARQGAFYGYAVRCDATTTTGDDIARGVVNLLIQFAPVKPEEYLVLQIQQPATVPS